MEALVDHPTEYSYVKDRFEPNMSCIYNQSPAFYLSPSARQPSNWDLAVYEATSKLPNTPGNINFVAASIGDNPAIVALAADVSNGQNYIGVTTNSPQYAALNNTQREVTFTQKTFSVSVDVGNWTISVAPLEETTWLPNKTVADHLSQQPVLAAYAISTSLSMELYANSLGNALMDNIQNMQVTRGNSSASNLAGIEAVLTPSWTMPW